MPHNNTQVAWLASTFVLCLACGAFFDVFFKMMVRLQETFMEEIIPQLPAIFEDVRRAVKDSSDKQLRFAKLRVEDAETFGKQSEHVVKELLQTNLCDSIKRDITILSRKAVAEITGPDNEGPLDPSQLTDLVDKLLAGNLVGKMLGTVQTRSIDHAKECRFRLDYRTSRGMDDAAKQAYQMQGQDFFEFVLTQAMHEIYDSHLQPELEGHIERERKPYCLIGDDPTVITPPLPAVGTSDYTSNMWWRIATESMRTVEVRLLDHLVSQYFKLALQCATGNAPGAGSEFEDRARELKEIRRTWEKLMENVPDMHCAGRRVSA